MAYISSGYREASKALALITYLLAATVCPSSALALTEDAASEQFEFTETPPWVELTEQPSLQLKAPDDIRDGLYYLVVDRQKLIAAGSQAADAHYSHYRYLLANTEGLESGSSFSINFDPSYDQLKLHAITVWRDGAAQQRLKTASYKVLNRESERENLIYNGELTLDVVLSDTRVGDVVDYSYSIEGANPVYDGLKEYGFDLTWGVPVEQVLYRVLAPKGSSLYQRRFASEQAFTLSSDGAYNEYRYQKYQVARDEADDHEELVLSDVDQWQQIINWSLPLYRKALSESAGVSEIAAQIVKEQPTRVARIGAALLWTQSNIRYLGVEYGSNSHNPSPAQHTLLRRYGDCKDKAVLLIALLKEMGIDADPALVFNGEHTPLDKSPYRLHAFNHVIVNLVYDNKNHWLDPTKNHQKGSLGQFSEPDYGYALVINPATASLTSMATDSLQGRMSVSKTIEMLDGHKASMHITTLRTLAEAEHHRGNLSRNGLRGVGENYLKYYKKYFDDIEQSSGLVVEDTDNNRTLSTERYLFPFDPKKGGVNSTSFARADDIANHFFDIDEAEPGEYLISEPLSIDETISIQYLDEIWDDSKSLHIENDFFDFNYKLHSNTDQRKVSLKYSYKVKQNKVPADKLAALQAEAKRVIDVLYLDLDSPLAQNQTPNLGVVAVVLKKWSDQILISMLIAFGLIYLYAFVEWQIDRRKARPNGVFYPISAKKYWLMSFTTAGLYSIYYLYRTFKYSKDDLSKRIWPAVRALFSGLFLYSAFSHVREYAREQQKPVHVGVASSVVLSVLFFLITIVGSHYIPVILALVAAACLYPLLRWVNALNADDMTLYQYNSRLRPRHILLTVMSPFLFLFTVPSELNIFPADSVVNEWQMWGFQKHFMEEHNILQQEESLQLFYSNASFDFRLDGNGLTDKQLFSYWVADDGSLEYGSILLDDISKLNIGQDSPDSILSGGWIKANNTEGSELTLVLPDIENCQALFIKRLRAAIPSNASYHCST